ncbi:FAD-binding domain-containing protein [Aulographum hederae CBS 113979]|uniref:FAD-binding domain-containing protein n=1 Tax=Aulographum hederae CBS 113979 TaxID=1176131 RepID=A0A6G1H2U6_9PEZI|nr:FAD-binding domain-containing protein [Aulographum hederae CBS 113979]
MFRRVLHIQSLLAYPSFSLSQDDYAWSSLNQSVNGRLHRATPFALPCFSSYNGQTQTPDLGRCSEIQSDYPSPTVRVDIPGAFMNSQSEICLSQSSNQCLLDGTNPWAPLATNASCLQGSVSDYYVQVIAHSDVVAAGHDYVTRSSLRDSLSLWTHHLQSISYSPFYLPHGCSSDAHSALTIGPGVSLDEAYAFADTRNVTYISGYASTVAAAGGWLLSGGHSVLSPVLGLGVDRAIEFKIVTPDGLLRIANACQNSDLFWALRGGGGGFGVVLESTSIVEPRMPVAVASITVPASTPETTHSWLELLVTESLRWGLDDWGGHLTSTTLIHMNPLLDLSAATASMNSATSFALVHNGSSVIEVLPSWYEVYEKYVIPSQRDVGAIRLLNSRLIRTAMFESPEGRAKIMEYLDLLTEMKLEPYIPVSTPLLYRNSRADLKAATSVTPAWRNTLWHLSTNMAIAWNSSYAERLQAIVGFTNLTRTLHELAPDSGAYSAESNPFTEDWKRDYWGEENYARLLEVKRKYDPDGLMGCWKCVGYGQTLGGCGRI